MGHRPRSEPRRVVAALQVAFVCLLVGFAHSQGLQTSPNSAPSMLRGLSDQGLDLAPRNPLGMPRSPLPLTTGSDTLPLSSHMFAGILPPIPNLNLSFDYFWSATERTGRFSGDYLLPVARNCGNLFFSEIHAEYLGFWNSKSSSSTEVIDQFGPELVKSASRDPVPNRFDLSLGGGLRSMMSNTGFWGVNAFWDSTRFFNKWYSSWGWGLELAYAAGTGSAVDLSINFYGNQFNRNNFTNAFRNKGNSFDLEAGFSTPIFNDSYDLRLSMIGYGFNLNRSVWGSRSGAEITTRDGVFSLRYEGGYDSVQGGYNMIGASVNMGFQLENLFRGESPLSKPEPVFASPRNWNNMLVRKVHRDWHQSSSVILASEASGYLYAHGLILPIQTGQFSANVRDTNPGASPVNPIIDYTYFDGQPITAVQVIFNVTQNPFAGTVTLAFGPVIAGVPGPNVPLMSGFIITGGQTGTFSFWLTPAQIALINTLLVNDRTGNPIIKNFRVESSGAASNKKPEGSVQILYYH